jgi:hypothetical protein
LPGMELNRRQPFSAVLPNWLSDLESADVTEDRRLYVRKKLKCRSCSDLRVKWAV